MADHMVATGETVGAECIPVGTPDEDGVHARFDSERPQGFSRGARLGWLAWLGIGAGGAAVVLTVRAMTRHPAGDWNAGTVVVAAILALAGLLLLGGLVAGQTRGVDRSHAWFQELSPPGVLLGLAFLATLIATVRRWEVDRGVAGWGVVVPWLAGCALFAAAAWWPSAVGQRRRPSSGDLVRMVRPNRTWVPWAGLAVLAGAPRLLMLDRYPAFINGDEGQYLMMAVGARERTIGNLFGAGWLEVPLLYPAGAGWLASVTGGDLAAHRLLGGLVGTIGVLATWRLGRWVVGPTPALVGASLLAVLPFHLLFSRSAMNHVVDPTTLMLALLFLWRGVAFERRGEVFLAGVFVGLGWYGYWGARSYPLILALLLLVVVVGHRVSLREATRLGVWVGIGFVATTAPLLMTFLMDPATFSSRLETTSIRAAQGGQNDWLELVRLYGDQVREAVFLPVIANRHIFYLHDAPFLGWPLALLMALGGAALLAATVRDRAWLRLAWLVVPWLVLTLGVAVSYPVESQRFVALVPLWMLLAGCGAVAVVRWLAWPLGGSRVVQQLLLGGLVASIGLSSLAWMMQPERTLENWGDPRTLAAWDLGWRLANSTDPSVPVVFVGAPHMFIDDWGSLRFLAPEADVQDADDDSELELAVPDGGLLVFVPERVQDLCALTAQQPALVVAEVRASNGTLLYVTLADQAIEGWPVATSPEGTTVVDVTATVCDSEPW